MQNSEKVNMMMLLVSVTLFFFPVIDQINPKCFVLCFFLGGGGG
jgi:hypothetical protein